MSKEKIVLSLFAIILGLFVAGGAFYIYQMTRTIDEPNTLQNISPSITSSPAQQDSDILIIHNPKDEQLFTKRIITVSGKTAPGATVIISSQTSDQVIEPSSGGDFSLTHTLEDGVNILKITAIYQNGAEQSVTRTVTSTTEDF